MGEDGCVLGGRDDMSNVGWASTVGRAWELLHAMSTWQIRDEMSVPGWRVQLDGH